MRPADLPGLGAYAHATRARYVAGCRCDECREANRVYAAQRANARRAGDYNGLVDASRARAHLVELRDAGVGRRSIADASGIPQSTVMAVLQGTKQRISARTERALLGVSTEAGLNDATLVPAAELLGRLEALRVTRGWTRHELAARMGYRSNGLQFRPEAMTARNVARVERFLRANAREQATANAQGKPPAPPPFSEARARVATILAGDAWAELAELATLAQSYGLPSDGDPWTLAARIRRHTWSGSSPASR